MFGINQLQVEDSKRFTTLGQPAEGDAAQKDANAEANKRFWIGMVTGTLVGLGFGYVARDRGWF
jgi:F0F1-type ATP synthase assembly protein I